jgi:SOS-response transcriptional repressor LexA
MMEAGILDGDLLFVIPTHELREAAKHIVICRVSGVTLAKQLELHAGRIRLLSRNERYTAIDADEENFDLIGTVAGRLGRM